MHDSVRVSEQHVPLPKQKAIKHRLVVETAVVQCKWGRACRACATLPAAFANGNQRATDTGTCIGSPGTLFILAGREAIEALHECECLRCTATLGGSKGYAQGGCCVRRGDRGAATVGRISLSAVGIVARTRIRRCIDARETADSYSKIESHGNAAHATLHTSELTCAQMYRPYCKSSRMWRQRP